MIASLFGGRYRLPVILQSERAECGLACIAMIASFFGNRIDLNTLRSRHEISGRGSRLSDLLSIGESISLKARPLKLDIKDLSAIQLPAVLHWDMNHFVVLKSVSKRSIRIHDPAVGERRYSMTEVGRHFTGIALEMTPGAEFQHGATAMRSRISDLYRRYPGFNRAVGQLFVLSLFLQLASIGSAFYMQLVIDEGVARQDADVLSLLALAFLMLGLTSVAMTYARSQVQLYFSNQIGFQMAGNVLTHLLSLPVSYFEKRHVGDLVSRFGSIREIRRILTEDLITVVLDGVFALITLLVMFYFSAMLALTVLLFVMVSALLKVVCIPAMQSLQEQVVVAEAKTSSQLMENMRTIEVIKFYCRELTRQFLWRNRYAEQINAQVRLARFSINIDAVYGVLTTAEHVVVVFLAASLVLEGNITLGFLTAFVALKGNFTSAIRSFIEKLVQIRLVRLQLERVSDITCAERETESLHMPAVRRRVKGQLTIENVSYTYPGAAAPIIDGISIDVKAGEVLAISGVSGAGKSTLLKIMAGLLKPTGGRVLVDGIDILQFGLREYRYACAGVLQTDQLLSGSIADNITLFDEGADQSLMELAAEQAGIKTFVAELPMGFNSLVGDMGSMMSAGQQQRILLARAFYKRPAIMFLDEATANLDEALEEGILKNLRDLSCTVVLISHRPVALRAASRIIQFSQL
ncbi:MAG: ABC transporter ATP-binding protein [Pseudohongiella sp.]|nr:ABC transporter ATP-binding protein [Pseudohongiella sp.]|tara:strand:- start:649 stop:2727 length:2079 start_codon:yes stop_codon:yes gene_type:complete